jgi:hypothetical protein
MASYFDEHDCQPLAAGQSPDHVMHMARLLVDTGYWNQVRDKNRNRRSFDQFILDF